MEYLSTEMSTSSHWTKDLQKILLSEKLVAKWILFYQDLLSVFLLLGCWSRYTFPYSSY